MSIFMLLLSISDLISYCFYYLKGQFGKKKKKKTHVQKSSVWDFLIFIYLVHVLHIKPNSRRKNFANFQIKMIKKKHFWLCAKKLWMHSQRVSPLLVYTQIQSIVLLCFFINSCINKNNTSNVNIWLNSMWVQYCIYFIFC